MKRIISFFFLLFFLSTPVFALSVPEKPQGYVNDYATLLSPSVRQNLEETLSSFDKETSNQVFVAIFPSLEGQSLEDFSIHLAEKWKPGTKNNNNGVILLIFRDDHKMRIEVGYGLEGALPDITANLIIQHEMVPYFRQGNFDEGVSRAVTAIMQATKGEYKASPVVEQNQGKIYDNRFYILGIIFFFLTSPLLSYLFVMVVSYSFFGPSGLFLGMIAIMMLAFLRWRMFLPFTGQTISGGGIGSVGGGGGFFSGGFGGGFSGGGGGGFGGGGASGGW